VDLNAIDRRQRGLAALLWLLMLAPVVVIIALAAVNQ
jgi:hypothetical protein